MDDARIKQLTEEVLGQIRSAGSSAEGSDLEGRVAALEAALHRLQAGAPAAATTVVVAQTAAARHASAGLLGPSGGGQGACVLEPDKPCVGSGQCRSFGH